MSILTDLLKCIQVADNKIDWLNAQILQLLHVLMAAPDSQKPAMHGRVERFHSTTLLNKHAY